MARIKDVERAEIWCMDRRGAREEDIRIGGRKAARMQNAGAIIDRREIGRLLKRYPSLKELHIVTHTGEPGKGCGAMGVIFAAIKKPEEYAAHGFSSKVNAVLVAPFRKERFSDSQELERINNEMQLRNAREVASGINSGLKVTAESIDLSKLGLQDYQGRHYLIVAKVSTEPNAELIKKAGAEMGGTYIVRGFSVSSMLPYIEVAVKGLHISDVRMAKGKGGLSEKEISRIKKFFGGSDIQFSEF